MRRLSYRESRGWILRTYGWRYESEPTHSLGELLLEWDRVSEQVAELLNSAPKAKELQP